MFELKDTLPCIRSSDRRIRRTNHNKISLRSCECWSVGFHKSLLIKPWADQAPGRGPQSRAAASAPPPSPPSPPPRCRCCPDPRPRNPRTPGPALSATLPTWFRRSVRWWRPGSAAEECSRTPPHSLGRSPPSRNRSLPVREPPSAYTPDTSS